MEATEVGDFNYENSRENSLNFWEMLFLLSVNRPKFSFFYFYIKMSIDSKGGGDI